MKFESQLQITTAAGVAPLTVNQTQLVINLNADLLDGQHGSYYQDAGNLNAGTVPSARLSGSYNINITGNAGGVSVSDSRSAVTTPQTINMGVVWDFKTNTTDGLNDGGTYFGEMTFRQYGSGTDWSGGLSHQLGFTDNGNIWQRSGSSTTWGSWKKLLDSSNYNSYSPTLTGTGASGNWPINITGQIIRSTGVIADVLAPGSGTYNKHEIYANATEFAVEGALATDVSTGTRLPIYLTWRGGYVAQGGFKLTGASSAELGGSAILHASNYSSYALPLSGGTLTGGLTGTSANFSGDVTWSGSNSGNARAVRIGYSGGNYGGISYGVNYTGTTNSYTYAFNDAVTVIELADGIYVSSAAGGAAGTAVSLTPLLVAARGNAALKWKGNNVLDSNNYNSYAAGLSTNQTFTGTNTFNGSVSITGGIDIVTSGTAASTSSLILRRTGQGQVSFGSYNGAWRSAIQIQSNANDRLLFLAPPEADYQYGILRVANGGLKIDVGGTTSNTGVNAVTIDTAGAVSLSSSLSITGALTGTSASFSGGVTASAGITITGSITGSRLYVSSLASAQTYSGTIHIRDTEATGSNNSFAGIAFSSGPGADYVIGKYTNGSVGRLQIRNHTGTGIVTIESDGATAFGAGVSATTGTFSGTGSFTGQLNANGGLALGGPLYYSQYTRRQISIAGPSTANFGNWKQFIRLWPTTGSGGNLFTLKVSVRGTWNYGQVYGTVEAYYTLYVPGDGTINATRDFRIIHVSGPAADNVRLGDVVIENGYASIPVWAANTNLLEATVEQWFGSQILGSTTAAVSETLPAFIAPSFRGGLTSEGALNVTGALTGTTGTFSGAVQVNNDSGVRASYDNGGSYAWLYGYGVEFGRVTSYVRPSTNRSATLFVGGPSINSLDWLNIDFYSSGRFTINNNAILHAGNYTSYTLPRGGSWYGVNLPGSRWGGFSANGGEVVFGQDLPNTGQMGVLIDGCYIAGENNGFWSLGSSNDWTTRRGMYFDGTYLRFDYNSATAYFSNASINGNQVVHAGNYTNYTPNSIVYPFLNTSLNLNTTGGTNEFTAFNSYYPSGGSYNQPVGGAQHFKILQFGRYNSSDTNYWRGQIAMSFYEDRMWFRKEYAQTWGGWQELLHGGNFSNWAIGRNGDTVDGVIYFRSNKGASSTVGANNSYALEAFSSDGGAAGMSFHRGGYYAVNMGLDPDNVLRIGGWSASANRWQLDMSGNQTLAGTITATGGTFNGSVSVGGILTADNSTATDVLRLKSGGSTIWKLGVYDTSGSYFNITADFGSFLINKSNGNVSTPGAFNSGYGSFTTPGFNVGDAQYGFYVSGGQLYYKSGSGGIHYWRNIANSANTMSLDNSGNLTITGVANVNGIIAPGADVNYAAPDGWTPGTGNGTGYYGGDFIVNGTAAENTRSFKDTPYASPGLVWATTNNDATSNDDGGWNKTITGLNASKTYRSIVWVRRSSASTNGNFYHGCSFSTTLNLDNTSNTNPYFSNFGIGTFTQGVWYLSVGYIHANGDASTTSYGGLYDATTGQKVVNYTDYKMAVSATDQVHRVYLYYSTDSTALLDFWGPRFEEVDGNEPSIGALLGFLPSPRFTGTPTVNGNTILHAANYSSYALPLSGGNVTGNVGFGASSPYGKIDLGSDVGRKLFVYGYGGNVGYITGLGTDLSGSSALSFFTGLGRFEWVKGSGNYPYSSYTVQMTLDASSNLNVTGTVTGSSFSGAGTGLTGTAASLNIGGTAAGLTNGSKQLSAGSANWIAWKSTSADSSASAIALYGSTGSWFGMLYGDAGGTGFLNTTNGWDLRKAINGELYATVSGTAQTVVHSGNYTSYPTSWGNITSKPSWMTATNLIADLPNFNNSVPSGFYQYYQATNSPSATWYNLINVRHSNTGNDHGFQLAMSYYDETLWSRTYQGGTGANNGTFTTWRAHLHSGNYNSYAPTLTGTGASGTWGISVTGSSASCTGNAATATNVAWSGITSKPTTVAGFGIADFVSSNSGSPVGADATTTNGHYYVNANISLFGQTDGALYVQGYSSSWVGQIYQDYRTGQLAIRGKNSNAWQSWRTVLDSSNYTSYSPSLTGSGASGSWGISVTGSSASCTGNAATATNVPWSGITSKPTTFSGYGISDIAYGSTGSRNVWTITDWNQTTYQNAHFLSSENTHTNGPSSDFIYGLQTSFHRSGAAYRTQMVTELYSSPVSIWVRNSRDSDVWTTWSKLLHSNNYTDYAPTKTGTGASGSWGINITGSSASCTGNAASATTAASCSGNAATCTTANGIADGTVSTTAKLANSVVTYAKIQNVGASSVLGNPSASVSQAPQEITFANLGPYINGVARAWVTFNENPTTGAITINASLGISSVTRINYGQYRVNFSTAFADANYAVSGTIGYESNGGYLYGGFLNIPRVATPKTTTYCEVTASYGDGNTYNARFVHVVFDR